MWARAFLEIAEIDYKLAIGEYPAEAREAVLGNARKGGLIWGIPV